MHGYVTVSDFEAVLARKMKVSNDDLSKLVRRFDWNNDGTVDHNNYIAWLFSGYNIGIGRSIYSSTVNVRQ